MTKLLVLLTLLTFLCACSDKNETLDIALQQSGNNKQEILKILAHFEQPGDSLKRLAAIFLIENMLYKSSYNKYLYKNKHEFFDSIKTNFNDSLKTKKSKDKKFQTLFKSNLLNNAIASLKKENDLTTIDSDYLIENIELAFYSWKHFPWSSNVSFEDFCNYILPYKVFDEPTDSWRETLMDRYEWVLDSIKSPTSLREATIIINNSFNTSNQYYPNLRPIPNALSFSELDSLKLGKCDHLVTMNVYALRAMGIPAAAELTTWANHRAGHSWCALIEPGNAVFAFDPLYPAQVSESVYLNSNFNHIPEDSLSKMKAAKIYRTSYKNHYPNIPSNIAETIEILKTSPFININLLDVTKEYKLPQSELNIELVSNRKSDILFLSIFNKDSWKKLVFSETSATKKYSFQNLGTRVVYKPDFLYDTVPLPPFIFKSDGSVKYLNANFRKTESIKLVRKYFTRAYVEKALLQTVGGIFQGANKSDFSDAEDLYEIKEPPKPWTNEYYFSTKKKYRYIRFILPDGLCRVAEMSFFAKPNANNKSGKLSGNWISNGFEESCGTDKIMDENVLTYFVSNHTNGGWVGVDLGTNKSFLLDKVAFYPPNDGNSIEKGDKYELYYWDKLGKWNSLGTKVAESEELIFKNCPTNALFIIKNLTKGSDVRIFTYEEGNQVWW